MNGKGNEQNNGESKEKLLPWNYAQKIATATGYSRSLVYKVAQGHHSNAQIERLLALAKQDKLAFAQLLERESAANKILQRI